MTDRDLHARIEELEGKLRDAQQTIQALMSRELDTIVLEGSSSPVLLRESQAKLRDSESFLRAIFDGAMDGMLVADDDGRYVDANPAACAMFGVPKEKILGRHNQDFIAPDQYNPARWQAFMDAQRMEAEVVIVRPDGSRRTLDGSAVANVLPGLHLVVLRDVTDRRAAERALHDAEQSLRFVISNAPVILFSFDRDGTYSLYEGRGIAALDLRPEDRVGRSVFEHFGKLPDAEAAIRRALAGETTSWAGLLRGGFFEAIFVPIVDASGSVSGVTGVGLDVTARRVAEEALRTSETRYRRIVENTSEGVWMYDSAGVTTFMNPRMASMLGFTVEEAIGQPIFAFMDEAAQAEARARTERRKRGISERGEFRLMRRDGSPIWISLHADPLFDAAGQVEGALALATDITDRRLADQTRNQLAAIVESSDDAIMSVTLDGTLTTWNGGAEALFGFTAAEMNGENVLVLLPPEHSPDDATMVTRVARGETVRNYETTRRRKDGTLVEVSLSVSPIQTAEGTVIGV